MKYLGHKFSTINWFELYGVVLIVSTFLSIAVMNVLLVVGLLYLGVSFIKRDPIPVGRLGKPIVLLFLVNVLSTLIYNPGYLNGAFVETGLLFVYFLFSKEDTSKRAFRILEISFYIIQYIGILAIAVFSYRFFVLHRVKLFWGRSFKAGRFMAIFAMCYLLKVMDGFLSGRFKRIVPYILGFFICSVFVLLSGKRSFMFALVFAIAWTIFAFWREIDNFWFKRGLLLLSFIFLVSGVMYTITVRHWNFNALSANKFSSGRVGIGKDAVEIIHKDILAHKYLPVLIGHGESCGVYLPHTGSYKPEKYESFFIIAELIEKGILGVFFELWLIYEVVSIFLFVLRKYGGYYKTILLWGLVPIFVHFSGMIFVFLKDPTLPTWLFMVRLVELSLNGNREDRNVDVRRAEN